MTTAIIPFAFDDHLVRAVWRDGEPWFVGKDVCGCLDIVDVPQALSGLDEDERGGCTVPTPGGEQKMIIVSEPGAYRLMFRSRKPEAERFKRWLAHDVLPQIRKAGKFQSDHALVHGSASDDVAAESMVQRLSVIREARILFGPARARSLWRKLGLPDVPPPPNGPLDEARACLRHLLEASVHVGGPAVHDALALALDDDENARVALLSCGIKVFSDRDAFAVANAHPGLARIFADTAWDGPLGHVRVLRRLPGGVYAGKHRYGPLALNGTELPGALIDDV